MRVLRQRLLLVAGWVVAAVATGLVSAGAVAVAGGQVTDRPLHPLSAAEVAALPVSTDDCGEEPPASGGYTLFLRCLNLAGGNGGTERVDESTQPAQKEYFVGDGDLYGRYTTGGYVVEPLPSRITPPHR
ncbi:hypothetical protein BH24ACT7_BH24ACT7_08090 [soil metagenome]